MGEGAGGEAGRALWLYASFFSHSTQAWCCQLADVLVGVVIEPNAILDLTALLATGRASDAVMDFLASGEQMTERVRAFVLSSSLEMLSG